MSFDFSTLITDRGLADVQLVQQLRALGWAGMTPAQQAQWSAGLKGAYNASDLNRVTACMDYLYQTFTSMGYPVPGYAVITVEHLDGSSSTEWVVGSTPDIPNEAQMTKYLANVQALMAVVETATYSAELPADMGLLTYVEANNIEQILFEINEYLTAIQSCYLRAGMQWASAGSPGFYFSN